MLMAHCTFGTVPRSKKLNIFISHLIIKLFSNLNTEQSWRLSKAISALSNAGIFIKFFLGNSVHDWGILRRTDSAKIKYVLAKWIGFILSKTHIQYILHMTSIGRGRRINKNMEEQ